MDEEARFPQEARKALVANDLHAMHVPEEYAGAGADALPTVIVDAGSDAAGMKTKTVRDGHHWVLNGVKRWITYADVSEYCTAMAVTGPTKRSKGISAFVVEESDEGVSFGTPEKKLGTKGSSRYEVCLDNKVRGLPGQRPHPRGPHDR